MNPIVGLSLGRIIVGLVSLVRPDLAVRLLGHDAVATPSLSLTARLFGSREIALGATTLLAKGRGRQQMILAGAAVDAADAGVAALALRDRSIGTVPGAALTGVALIAMVQGLQGLRRK